MGAGTGSGCGAGAPGDEDGLGSVLVGTGPPTGVCFDRDENIKAVRDAPAAAEPAAIKASVDLDILTMDQ